jgi:hypothetical protein
MTTPVGYIALPSDPIHDELLLLEQTDLIETPDKELWRRVVDNDVVKYIKLDRDERDPSDKDHVWGKYRYIGKGRGYDYD